MVSFKSMGLSEPTPRPMRLNRGSVFDLVGPDDGAKNLDLHVNTLNADAGMGPRHYHERADNVYVVLDGAIEIEIDGETRRVGTGEVAYIAPGVPHSTGPAEGASARIIEIYAPAGPDFHLVEERGA